MQKYYSYVLPRVLRFASVFGEHRKGAAAKLIVHANSCVRVLLNGRNHQL